MVATVDYLIFFGIVGLTGAAMWAGVHFGTRYIDRMLMLPAVDPTKPIVAPPRPADLRAAFRAGYWAWCGPANEREYGEAVKGEQEAWDEWYAARANEQQALSPEKRSGT